MDHSPLSSIPIRPSLFILSTLSEFQPKQRHRQSNNFFCSTGHYPSLTNTETQKRKGAGRREGRGFSWATIGSDYQI
jgi:hypothetical protein